MRFAFIWLWKIFGVLLFSFLFSFTIIFAEGYEYDAESREFIKKGVLLLEKVKPLESEVWLDFKKVEITLPGELRLTPGVHLLEITSPHHYPWRENILIPASEVLRIPKIRLKRIYGPDTPHIG